MIINRHSTFRALLVITLIAIITVGSSRLQADSGSCGGVTVTVPFGDVAGNLFFCQIAEAFFSGLTSGTTPTTYSPSQNVPREQMAAFITRTMDQSLKRGSKRAALNHFWTPTSVDGLGLTDLATQPFFVESDGADLWVTHTNASKVSRVRASDGKLLDVWTGTTLASNALAAKGLIYVTGSTNPGSLYLVNPTLPGGFVTTLSSTLGAAPVGIAFDGARIWTANDGGSVSIVSLRPISVTTVTLGFSEPAGIVFDGANIWVTDQGAATLLKLGSSGAILQTVPVGLAPRYPVFDGTNIWVPNNQSHTVTVVRASTGVALATLSGNGLNFPVSAAFDGERILVTSNESLSLWKSSDLSPLGSFDTTPAFAPLGACSDGLHFWVAFNIGNKLARF